MIVVTDGMTRNQELLLLWSFLWPYLVALVILLCVVEALHRWEHR